jgi:hypothetical protein
MGLPVLILGESGSGKTASLREFAPEEISIFNVAGKPLPFKKRLATLHTHDYTTIKGGLLKSEKNAFVIDDSQYLLCFELFDRADERGYDKFTDMACKFYSLVKFVIEKLPPQKIVYFLHHTETTDTKIKAKTVGRMLDEKLTLEGLFSIVLLCKTDGMRHWFTTQSDGFTTAKSPMEMFPPEIDNDLRAVDQAIREYYEM